VRITVISCSVIFTLARQINAVHDAAKAGLPARIRATSRPPIRMTCKAGFRAFALDGVHFSSRQRRRQVTESALSSTTIGSRWAVFVALAPWLGSSPDVSSRSTAHPSHDAASVWERVATT